MEIAIAFLVWAIAYALLAHFGKRSGIRSHEKLTVACLLTFSFAIWKLEDSALFFIFCLGFVVGSTYQVLRSYLKIEDALGEEFAQAVFHHGYRLPKQESRGDGN